MDHAPEGEAGQRLELLQAVAAEDIADGLVGVEQLLVRVRLVDEEPAGHVLAELLDHGEDLLDQQLLFGLPDGQHGHGDGDGPGYRIDADAPREGVHDGAVRHLLVIEGADALLTAGPDHIVHEGGVVLDELRSQARKVHPEEAPEEVAVGLVGTHEARAVALDLDDAHGQRGVGVLQGALLLPGDDVDIVEVQAADRLVVGGFPGVFVAGQPVRPVVLEGVVDGIGLAEIEPLHFGAADLLEEVHLILRLHALADRVHAQRRGHLHQLGQYDPAVGLVQPAHEAHVEFQQVELDALQYVQRRIPAAEVVHPHREAQRLEALDLRLHELKVAADDALRDLDADPVPGNARRVHAPPDLLHHVAGVEVGAGQVDGVRHDVKALGLLDVDVLQHPLQHIQVQLVDQAGVLEIVYEVGRGQEALDRVDPSRQGLLVADLAVDGPHDGLVVDLYPVLGKRAVKVLKHVLMLGDPLAQRAVVDLVGRGVGALERVAGDLRPVIGRAHRDHLDPVRVDADADGQVLPHVHLPPLPEQPVEQRLEVVLVGDGGVAVGADMTAVFRMEDVAQKRRERLEQLVALGEPELVVVVLHAAQVDVQKRRKPSVRKHRQPADLRQLKEIRHIRQPGQGVVAVGLDDAPLVKRPVQGIVEPRAGFVAVVALLRVPDVGQVRAVLRIHVLADQVDHRVSGAVLLPRPVDHLEPAALGDELQKRAGKTRGVVRMDVLVHVLIHIGIRLRTVPIAKQLAKSVRYGEGHDSPIHKLAYDKGLPHRLDERQLIFRELVSFHDLCLAFRI